MPLRRSAPLRRGLPPKPPALVRKKRLRPRRGPERCPDYLAWIRTLPCVVCGRASGIEAAHTNALGPRRMAQKTSDFSALPLCAMHHRSGPDSYHRLGEKHFATGHRVDLLEVALTLRDQFSRQMADAAQNSSTATG